MAPLNSETMNETTNSMGVRFLYLLAGDEAPELHRATPLLTCSLGFLNSWEQHVFFFISGAARKDRFFKNMYLSRSDPCGRMWVCLRPDLAERMVKDSAGQERPIKVGPKLWVSCSNFDVILSDG